MKDNKAEMRRQDGFSWSRSTYHVTYNAMLAQYKIKSCLENSKGDSLIDLACGDGLMTESFAKHFKRVVGVDASAKHLAEAKKRCPHVTFYESLIEDLDIEEKFDSVFMLDVLEHVIDPILLLKKATGFLNDEGIIIVHVPNSDALNRKIAVFMGTLTSCEELSPFDVNIAGHRRSYNLKTLTEDINEAGLKIQKTGGIFYKMLSTPQMDWFLENGLWEGNNFGWGRVGAEQRDWRSEFCRACYEIGNERPEDCNIIYAVITKGQ